MAEKRDLAELRGRGKKRNRAKFEQERLANQAEENQRLQRKVAQVERAAWWQGLLHSRTLRKWILITLSCCLLLGIAGGAWYWYSHPHLSQDQVQQGLPAINVEINGKLGANAKAVDVSKVNNRWEATYIVPARTRLFTGGRTRDICQAIVRIPADQRPPINRYTIIVPHPCKR